MMISFGGAWRALDGQDQNRGSTHRGLQNGHCGRICVAPEFLRVRGTGT